MSDVIRNPSPVQQRLIEQLLVTVDEDAALSKREGVGAKFDELDGEAETLADGDLGHGSAAEHVKSERAASISNFATRITPQTGQRHNRTEDDIKNYYTSLGAVVPKFGVVTTNDAGVPAASVSLEKSDAAVDDAKTKTSPKEYAKILKALRHTNLEFAEKFAGREEQLMVMRHAVRAICKRHRIPDVLVNIHQNLADNNGRYVEEVQSDDALAINDEIGRMILAKLTIEKQKEMLKRGVTSATRIMATLQQPFGFGGVRRLALEKQLKDLRLQQTAAPIHDMLWRADLIEEELTELGTSTDARTRWEVRCQAARHYGPKVVRYHVTNTNLEVQRGRLSPEDAIEDLRNMTNDPQLVAETEKFVRDAAERREKQRTQMVRALVRREDGRDGR